MLPPSPFDPPRADLALPDPEGVLGASPRSEMEYMDAYQSFFRCKRWGMNLLLLTVCTLIPIVGILVQQGYFTTTIARRHVLGERDPQEFDFSKFGAFLERGLWPFLLGMLLVFATLPVFGVAGGLIYLGTQTEAKPMMMASILGGSFLLLLVFGLLILGVRPLVIRAALLQSLSGVFSFAFVADFWKRMWVEIIVSQMFMAGSAMVLVILGYMMCGLGLYPAMALMSYAVSQLDLQLYEVYVSRGGTPISIDPRLSA